MSKITDANGKTIIELRFPTERLKEILLRLQFSSEISELSIQQAKIVLAVIVREFLKGNLFLEEMAMIISSLGLFFLNHESEDRIDGYTLDEITFEATEMCIDSREVFGDHQHETYDWYMQHLMEYLRVNSFLIEIVQASEYKVPSYFEEKYAENYDEIKENFAYGENVVTKTAGP